MSKKIYHPVGGTFGETVIKALKEDEALRQEYLKDLLTEQDLPMLALSLKYVVEALGGAGKLSRETGLSRQNLYKALSGKKRPVFSTLVKILDFAGYELSLKKKEPVPAGAPMAHETQKTYGGVKGKAMKPGTQLAAEIDRKADPILSGKRKARAYKGSIKDLL